MPSTLRIEETSSELVAADERARLKHNLRECATLRKVVQRRRAEVICSAAPAMPKRSTLITRS